MEELVLKKVVGEYGDDIFSYKNEFVYNNESMDGTGFLRNANSPQEFIEKSILNETKVVLCQEKVQVKYEFFISTLILNLIN